MAKKMTANLILSVLIAIIEPIAITNAMIGKNGYIGTRKGLASEGSFLRNINTAIIAKIYNMIAPKQAIVMISPVLPVNNAMMPMDIFNTRALAGVLNFG